ncbi:MAG: HD domain-containing phosphohydrolase, partial [Solirubrobacteraceae bacterium]
MVALDGYTTAALNTATVAVDHSSAMSQQPTLEEQELLAETLRRVRQRIPARESAAEILVAIGFVLAAVAIWLIDPPRWWAWAPALLCSVVLVLAIRVRFDTPFGFTGATQLGFVPLLFALPVAAVPFVVAAALLVALLPEVVGGEVRAGRLLFCFGNAWFAIGPAAVFALSGTSPRHAGAGLLLAALAAQFALDFAVSTLRFADREAGLFVQVRETWVYANDAALSAIAILVAQDVGRTPLAALAPLPLLGLLAVFARERHRRIESLIELNEAYRGTALVLGDVVAADDGYTGEHSRGVVALALELGARLGLDAQQRRNLEFGALLHDVGKIAIPKEIINKPGTLDPREW